LSFGFVPVIVIVAALALYATGVIVTSPLAELAGTLTVAVPVAELVAANVHALSVTAYITLVVGYVVLPLVPLAISVPVDDVFNVNPQDFGLTVHVNVPVLSL
jgi:hypothetical protein